MRTPSKSRVDLLEENAGLHARLEEAEKTALCAIGAREADARVVDEQTYSLPGTRTPCRVLIEAMTTAHATKGDAAIALKAGCAGHLTKPINTRTFVASVTRFIAAASRRRINQ